MSTKIFIWKNFADWHGIIEEMLLQGSRKKIVERIRKNRECFKYIDDLNLFKTFYSEFGDYSILEDTFVTDFPLRFPFVRMYHCCRPTDTRSYYAKGICVLDLNEANERFRNMFLDNPSCPNINKSHIDNAISSMAGSYKRHGYIYFGLDDRFLITYCNHYLIYGSEYINGLAAFLEKELGCPAKSELKKYGMSTIFEVNIPVKQISSGELRELAQYLLPAWSFAIAHDKNEIGKVDVSIEIDHNLSPELIVGHYHPTL